MKETDNQYFSIMTFLCSLAIHMGMIYAVFSDYTEEKQVDFS